MICDLIDAEGDRVRIVDRLEIEMISLVCCDLTMVSLVIHFVLSMNCDCDVRMSGRSERNGDGGI